MRTDENTFEFLYYEELRLIPRIFRCTKAGFVSALILMAGALISGLYFHAQYIEISNNVPLDDSVLIQGGFIYYDHIYLTLTFVCFLILALTAGWLVICRYYENTAYKKASRLAGMVLLDEHHKMLVTWKERKSGLGDN